MTPTSARWILALSLLAVAVLAPAALAEEPVCAPAAAVDSPRTPTEIPDPGAQCKKCDRSCLWCEQQEDRWCCLEWIRTSAPAGEPVAEGGRCLPCDRSCFGGGGTCVERNNGKLCCEGSILQGPTPGSTLVAALPDPEAQCRPCDRLCISSLGTCVTRPNGKRCCEGGIF